MVDLNKIKVGDRVTVVPGVLSDGKTEGEVRRLQTRNLAGKSLPYAVVIKDADNYGPIDKTAYASDIVKVNNQKDPCDKSKKTTEEVISSYDDGVEINWTTGNIMINQESFSRDELKERWGFYGHVLGRKLKK